MTTEAIYSKYWAALMEVDAVMVPADTAIALALRLAVADAYDAGGAVAADLVAIVAEQATPERSPADQRYAEQLQAQISRLNEWLAEKAPSLYRDTTDTATAVLAVIDALQSTAAEYREQLVQLDADNADLTQQVAGLAGGRAEAERLRQEIADLREQVIPDYQAELANLVSSRNELQDRIDALTKIRPAGKIVDIGTVALPLGTNGAAESAAMLPATWWYDGLDAETNDWRISLDAGRRTFRQLSKRTRLLLLQAFARYVGNGNLPTQAAFDAARPSWMPGGSGLVTTFGCAWTELLTLTPFEVEP